MTGDANQLLLQIDVILCPYFISDIRMVYLRDNLFEFSKLKCFGLLLN